MAAVARPSSRPDDNASPGVTRPGRSRVSRTEVDYRKLHRGTVAKERISSQAADGSSDVQESRLDTVLRAIAGVRESVDERFALVQEAIAERSDIEQIKEAISEDLRNTVQDRLKVTVQREIVNAIREEVTRTVQEQVSEVVRREVKSVVQHEVKSIVDDKVAAIIQQEVTNIVKQQVTTIVQQQVTTILEKQLSSIQQSSPNPSYADVARTPPGSHPTNLRTISNQTAPSTLTDTLYCTVDVSNVEEADRGRASASLIRQEVEKEMRDGEGGSGWRCVAVTRDPRNAARIRITCRDEDELVRIKEAAERTKTAGSRVLRDQWYPVKVDNACRVAVLDENGDVRTGVTEMLEKENGVKIAKLSWLSRKDSPKAYGSMVVYVTKRADAAKLLDGQYFDVDGESAFTRVFVPRRGPMQCFKCLGLGHKAFSCTMPQVCSRCAQPGHRHSECQAESPRCAVCGGPHESSSRQAVNVGFSIRRLMSRSMRFLQLNVQKQRNVQHGGIGSESVASAMYLLMGPSTTLYL